MALVPLQLLGERRLLQDQFCRHSHQLGVSTHFLRIAGDADHPDQLPLIGDGQIDAGSHPFELQGCRFTDLHHPVFGQRQHGPFVALMNPLRIAGRNDEAVFVHHVDRKGEDLHRPCDDLAGKIIV